MNLFGVIVPQWVLDWSGALLVVASLAFLVRKSLWYWHLGNASLLPYFLLFLSTNQLMAAGLQVSYLVFGVHGLYLWLLEHRRDRGLIRFHEPFWYNLGWVLALCIFAFTATITEFADAWSWVQFAVVALSLFASWGTTRKWTWSWGVWIAVNCLQIAYFAHLGLWGQFGLQFVLISMSAYGLLEWTRHDRAARLARVGGEGKATLRGV